MCIRDSYSPIPVYNLVGLANNRGYKTAAEEGRHSEYFSEKEIKYLAAGHSVVYGAVSGITIRKNCTDPLYRTSSVSVFAVENCRLDFKK